MANSSMKQRVISPDMSLISSIMLAEQMDSPNNVNWKISIVAPVQMDDSNNALAIRAFNDTTEEGVGFMLFVPDYARSIKLNFISRAKVAPGSVKNVVPKIYSRIIGDNIAVGAWNDGLELTAIVIPTNLYFQYDTQTIDFVTLGITKNKLHQFELTRKTSGVTNNLVGDWYLMSIEVLFI